METIAYEELLARDGQVTTHVVGTSMLPLLHNRQSIVTVESVSRVPPRRGDVVLYKVSGTYILHRVIRIQGGDYLIRGDNTWVMEHVPASALLATMTGFYRTPKGRLITRRDCLYRLYRLALPSYRWGRRIGSWVKRRLRNVIRIKGFSNKM